MKRKYAAMILGLTMALTSVNMAYAASDTTTEAAADTATDTEDTTTSDSAETTEVYGEVTEVGEDSITINVGTMKEGQQPGDGQAPQDGEKPDDAKEASDSADTDSKDENTEDKSDADTTDQTEDDSSDAKTDDTKADDKSGDQKPADGQAPEMKTEAIALTDIQVGDTIKVTLDADGNATAVVVMNAGAPEAKDGE